MFTRSTIECCVCFSEKTSPGKYDHKNAVLQSLLYLLIEIMQGGPLWYPDFNQVDCQSNMATFGNHSNSTISISQIPDRVCFNNLLFPCRIFALNHVIRYPLFSGMIFNHFQMAVCQESTHLHPPTWMVVGSTIPTFWLVIWICIPFLG